MFEKDFIRKATRSRLRQLINYFLKGLLITLPIFATYYILSGIIIFTDNLIPIEIPGVGFFTVIIGITIIGIIGSAILIRPILDLFDDLLMRIPFIKLIYSSIKDLMEAFVGDQRKFKTPVLVEMSNNGIMKIGFVTQNDLTKLGIEKYVAVYFPHSYNFSGNLFIVPSDKIKAIDVNSTELMKFVVSGGVTHFEA